MSRFGSEEARRRFRKLDLTHVLNASVLSRRYIDGVNKCANDIYKELRVIAQECQRCYYITKVGGASMTTVLCGICEKEMMFGSTCTDTVCLDCAKKHRLCKHCGGDIDMKTRRKI